MAIRNPFAGHSGSRRAFKNKSRLARRRLNTSGIETFLGLTDETIAGAGPFSSFVELTPLRGLIQTKERTNPTAFGHRGALAVVQYGGYWTEEPAEPAMVNHQRRMRAAMEPWWGNAAFYNYADRSRLG